jgi:hypothetical protein
MISLEMYLICPNRKVFNMAKAKIDENKLAKLVDAGTAVDEIASQLGMTLPYARTKVKEYFAKKAAADYPGLFGGRGGGGVAASQIQPKLSKKGAINLNKKLLDSWDVKPPEGTVVQMKVSRDKTKITLVLGDESE